MRSRLAFRTFDQRFLTVFFESENFTKFASGSIDRKLESVQKDKHRLMTSFCLQTGMILYRNIAVSYLWKVTDAKNFAA